MKINKFRIYIGGMCIYLMGPGGSAWLAIRYVAKIGRQWGGFHRALRMYANRIAGIEGFKVRLGLNLWLLTQYLLSLPG